MAKCDQLPIVMLACFVIVGTCNATLHQSSRKGALDSGVFPSQHANHFFEGVSVGSGRRTPYDVTLFFWMLGKFNLAQDAKSVRIVFWSILEPPNPVT